MKIVKSGSVHRIYGEDLIVLDKLPAKTYKVCFSKLMGFYLETHPDLENNEEKIYGVHMSKIKKVMNAFDEFNRSLGVILSGDKGIGKSLFARMTCIEAQKKGLPVIIVSDNFPGMPDFLTEIEQEVVVLFDEFDKTFKKIRDKDGNDSGGTEAALLSLFDGVAPGKKLYVVTCNNIHSMNEYLINRPGRFHYHFRFEYPTPEEITTYLKDKIAEQYYNQIPKVISFAAKIKLNYDCLRAIAFELNNGESFGNAVNDLNILNTDEQRYDISIHFCDGLVFEQNCSIDMFSSKPKSVCFRDVKHDNEDVYVTFIPSNGKYDVDTKSLFFDETMLDVHFEYENYEPDEGKEKREYPSVSFMKATTAKTTRYSFGNNGVLL